MSDVRTEFDCDISESGDIEARIITTQDNVPVLTRNEFEKYHGNNGFSQGRTLRKVASVPVVALENARAQGINVLDQKELKAWLFAHPEFLTVQGINTGRSGQIIVR
jgi:hypothetical protein